MDRPDEPPERGLRDHLGILRRRAPIIVGIALLVAVAALVASLLTPTRYTATAEVLYPQSPPSLQDPTRLDANRVMQNESRVVRSQLVRNPVEEKIGSPASTSVRTVRDADTLLISATASTAERAAEIANTTADVYVELRTPPGTSTTGTADESSKAPTVINHASPPSRPSQPTTVRNVLLALLLGLILGVTVAYIVDRLAETKPAVADD